MTLRRRSTTMSPKEGLRPETQGTRAKGGRSGILLFSLWTSYLMVFSQWVCQGFRTSYSPASSLAWFFLPSWSDQREDEWVWVLRVRALLLVLQSLGSMCVRSRREVVRRVCRFPRRHAGCVALWSRRVECRFRLFLLRGEGGFRSPERGWRLRRRSLSSEGQALAGTILRPTIFSLPPVSAALL